jgi:glutamate--cysteine ligase catalytic subunit
MDVNTTAPDNGTKSDPEDYRILMDAMGFGAGCSALQCTMQATNFTEARIMFDQLAAFAPIMVRIVVLSMVYFYTPFEKPTKR